MSCSQFFRQVLALYSALEKTCRENSWCRSTRSSTPPCDFKEKAGRGIVHLTTRPWCTSPASHDALERRVADPAGLLTDVSGAGFSPSHRNSNVLNGILRDTETFGTDSDDICFLNDGARVDQDFKETETFCTDSDNVATRKLVGLLLVGKLSGGLLLGITIECNVAPHLLDIARH